MREGSEQPGRKALEQPVACCGTELPYRGFASGRMRPDIPERKMRTGLLTVGLAFGVLVSAQGVSGTASAAGVTGSVGTAAEAGGTLVHQAKRRGHAYGHRVHRNRGLHRGWKIGRGNKHR